MTEYISREAALEEVKTGNYILAGGDKAYLVYMPYRDMVKHLQNIPAADVAPVVHGRWVKNDNGTWSCERCHSWIPNEQHYYARFCLHCGAKMDGGENAT